MTGTGKEQSYDELAVAEQTRDVPVFTPRFDIIESSSELTLFGDLPGVKVGEIDIRYENDQLVIHGKVSDRNEGIAFLRQEYGVGDFHRSFTIGEAVDASKIVAETRNGVLTIHLPKTEAAKPRRIKVKSV